MRKFLPAVLVICLIVASSPLAFGAPLVEESNRSSQRQEQAGQLVETGAKELDKGREPRTGGFVGGLSTDGPTAVFAREEEAKTAQRVGAEDAAREKRMPWEGAGFGEMFIGAEKQGLLPKALKSAKDYFMVPSPAPQPDWKNPTETDDRIPQQHKLGLYSATNPVEYEERIVQMENDLEWERKLETANALGKFGYALGRILDPLIVFVVGLYLLIRFARRKFRDLMGPTISIPAKPVSVRSDPPTSDPALLYECGMALHQAERHDEAAKLIRESANFGNAAARALLGVFYFYGKGVKQDYAMSKHWIHMAAEQGDPTGQYFLGIFHSMGINTIQDHAKALSLYTLAADQGHALAQSMLGSIYYDGMTGPKDYSEAARWYRNAAYKGYPQAQYMFGTMLEDGLGIEKNPGEAVKWFRAAAEQGHNMAAQRLGEASL